MTGMLPTDRNGSSLLRVVVVDADDLVRESLSGLLRIGDQVDVVGDAAEAEGAMQVILTARPDVVVIDPRIPELATGLAFIERLKDIAPWVRVLALGSSPVPEGAGLGDGVDGWLRKTFRPADLTAAILATGRRPLD